MLFFIHQARKWKALVIIKEVKSSVFVYWIQVHMQELAQKVRLLGTGT